MTLTHDWSSVEVAMIIQDECCHFSLKKCCTLKYNLSKKILVKSSSVFGWFTSVWTAWNLQLWRKTKTCSALGALSWEGAAAKLTVLTTAIQGEAVVSKRSQRLSARLSERTPFQRIYLKVLKVSFAIFPWYFQEVLETWQVYLPCQLTLCL